MTTRTKTALWLLIAPTVLLIITFVAYAIVNGAVDGTGASIMNVILFFLGVLGVLTWLPGIITGIILLATKK